MTSSESKGLGYTNTLVKITKILLILLLVAKRSKGEKKLLQVLILFLLQVQKIITSTLCFCAL